MKIQLNWFKKQEGNENKDLNIFENKHNFRPSSPDVKKLDVIHQFEQLNKEIKIGKAKV